MQHQMLRHLLCVLNVHEIESECAVTYWSFNFPNHMMSLEWFMFSGTTQTLGIGRHQVGGYHGDQEEGGWRPLWGQSGGRRRQSRLQVTRLSVQSLNLDDISHFLLNNPPAILIFGDFFFLCLTEQSRNLQTTWKKSRRPAVSLLRRRAFWNRDSTFLFLLLDSNF